MELHEALIIEQLRLHPGSAYITSDGKSLYALTEGGMLHWTGVDFGSMTDDEINVYIRESLKHKKS